MLFRRAPQKVEELKIVIVGAGEVGFHIAQRLSEEQKQVVVIDQNPDKLRRIEDHMDVQPVRAQQCGGRRRGHLSGRDRQ